MNAAATVEQFRELLCPIFDAVRDRPLDAALEAALGHRFPPDGAVFGAVERACHQAIAAGWMCAEGGKGRRFGRVIEPSDQTSGLSVDVVDLTDVKGPHHRHPSGEICMIMPLTASARFDGRPRGWCIYEADSAHYPTVTGGRALVLYMLPGGKIEFTGQ